MLDPAAESLYPECIKLDMIGSDSIDDLHGFLEYLRTQGYHLAVYVPDIERFLPVNPNDVSLVYGYFGIDEKKIEQERRAMLTAMRQANAASAHTEEERVLDAINEQFAQDLDDAIYHRTGDDND